MLNAQHAKNNKRNLDKKKALIMTEKYIDSFYKIIFTLLYPSSRFKQNDLLQVT